MNNIRFEKIEVENFMSFKKFSMDFTNFEKQTVLVTGKNEDISNSIKQASNGSGKTTVFNCILFAIYGELLNPIKNKYIRSWNSSSKEDVIATITITSRGTRYAISRILKGKNCSAELHVFKYKENNDIVEITLSTMDETQRFIETEIVPCGKEGFLRCIILTADQNYNFFKLNKSAKNSFFESLFELTTYSDMFNRLHRKTLDESALLTASSKTIDNLNSNISKLENERELANKNKKEIIDASKILNELNDRMKEFNLRYPDIEEVKSKFQDSANKENLIVKKSVEEKVADFDAKNNIIHQNGKIKVNIDFDNELNKAIEKFDIEHDVLHDEDGNIFFNTKKKTDELNEKIETIKSRISKGKLMIETVENDIETIKNDINSNENGKINAQNKIHNINETLNSHSKITDILCSDCLPKYKNLFNISNFEKTIKILNENIVEYNSNIELLSKKKDDKSSVYEKYKTAKEKLNDALSELKARLTSITSENNAILKERELLITKISNDNKAKINEIMNDRKFLINSLTEEYNKKSNENIQKCNDQIRRITDENDRIINSINNAKYKLEILKENSNKTYDAPISVLKESLSTTVEEFNEHTKNISYYKALEEVLKPDNIRKSVVKDMLTELNRRISGYLAKMGSDYICNFDEDFDAVFVSKKGNEADYNNFSSGEKMRMSIACCLAFKDFMEVRLNIRSNILVIDEYIDSTLDAMAIDGIMDLIHYIVGTENIAAFIISHRIEVKENTFDSEIFVKKSNGITTVSINGIAE